MAEDESYFDCYVFTGRPKERVVVEMRSGDFDAYTALYRGGVCDGEQRLTAWVRGEVISENRTKPPRG